MQELPVYLVLGFLEAGKTKFIQETFEDERFDSGERTLLLVMEEGEEGYDHGKFANPSYAVETLDPAEMSEAKLASLAEKYSSDRIVVEYNGMHLLQEFFDAMPEDWVINQMMTFFDSATFLNYNRNMRQLVYDKIQLTQMVVFNRFKGEYDKTEFHKVVRAISRRPDIVYEYIGGKAEFDDIEDPLPFDVNAPVIEIEDKDYALFYRDIAEKMQEYIGKTVRFKGMAAVNKKVPAGYIVLGRYIMTCCEADIAYDGFAVRCGKLAEGINTRDWLCVTGKVMYEYNSVYRSKGPVIVAEKIERAQKPEQEVATFY